MKVVLTKEKIIPFEFENGENPIKGEFVCDNLKASEQVSLWVAFRAIEGDEETKAKKQTELVISKFSSAIKKINFAEETTFGEEGTENEIDPKTALVEYFSFPFYQIGMKFLTPNFGGSEKDPLELSSKGS